MIFLLTGKSGSGKSTLASELSEHIEFALVDGDVIRDSVVGKTASLGHGKTGRETNCQIAGTLAKHFSKTNDTVIACLESPTVECRDIFRKACGLDITTIHIKASTKTCIARDPKGLYAKDAEGLLEVHMVGDSFELGHDIDETVTTDRKKISTSVKDLLNLIKSGS